jgi:modulator of FtsH protease HflK
MSGNFVDNLNLPPEVKKFLRNTRLVILVLVGVIVLFSSIFQVETEEVGVITRFGAYSRTVEPGLNLKVPFVESVYKVPVERQQKLEFGFRTLKSDVQSTYGTNRETDDESLMLTGDLNLANVEWVVQYRVEDAYKYLFKVRNIEATLREISESAMRQIVGDRTVNEVLTIGRTDITREVEQLIQVLCKEYSMGIKIEQIVLQDVNPPEPVKAAFNEVNQAQQEKETLINKAKSDYNKVIPKADGEADETIQKAEGYAIERVNNAKGEATRFNSLYAEYVKAPEVTKRRLYLETMANILPRIGNVVVTDQKGNNLLPLLNLSLNEKTAKP